jgi:hypothetical protein
MISYKTIGRGEERMCQRRGEVRGEANMQGKRQEEAKWPKSILY